MAIDLSNPEDIRANVYEAVEKALREVVPGLDADIDDIYESALEYVWSAFENRDYLLAYLRKIKELLQVQVDKSITYRTDKFKASMTFSALIDKFSAILYKLRQS